MSRKSRPEESTRGSDLDSLGYGATRPFEDERPPLGSGFTDLDGDDLLDSFDEKWPEGLLLPGTGAGEPTAGTSLALSGTLADRIALLRERIDALKKATARRRRLHRTVQGAVRTELRDLDHLLRDVRVWSLGVSPSVDGRRTNLERETIALKRAGWEERLRHWRDLVWLEKELHEAIERYRLSRAAEGLPLGEEDEDSM